MPRRFVLDLHLDPAALGAELSPAPVSAAARRNARTEYAGPEPSDEDRHHVLQLAFERDATLLTADGGILSKARGFGPCFRNNHVLGGVIVLPTGKERQIAALRAFKDGSLPVRSVDPGDFDEIWNENLGVDLRQKTSDAIELCRCLTEDEKLRHYKRYKRK